MVYVFLADGFEEMEAIAPVDILRRLNIPVTTVGVTGKISGVETFENAFLLLFAYSYAVIAHTNGDMPVPIFSFEANVAARRNKFYSIVQKNICQHADALRICKKCGQGVSVYGGGEMNFKFGAAL